MIKTITESESYADRLVILKVQSTDRLLRKRSILLIYPESLDAV